VRSTAERDRPPVATAFGPTLREVVDGLHVATQVWTDPETGWSLTSQTIAYLHRVTTTPTVDPVPQVLYDALAVSGGAHLNFHPTAHYVPVGWEPPAIEQGLQAAIAPTARLLGAEAP